MPENGHDSAPHQAPAPGLTPELSIRQQRGLSALLAERTIEGAARRAFVSSRTLRRWLRGSAPSERRFQEALAELRGEALAHDRARLAALTGAAVDALRDVLADPSAPAQARVSAANTVLRLGSLAARGSGATTPMPDPASLTDEQLEALLAELAEEP